MSNKGFGFCHGQENSPNFYVELQNTQIAKKAKPGPSITAAGIRLMDSIRKYLPFLKLG